jgi:hypothetical protein
MRYLAPIIKDRQQYIDEYGKEREDKPVCSFVSSHQIWILMWLERSNFLADG